MKRIVLIIENSREYGRGLVRGIAGYGQERRDWLLRLLTPSDISDPCSLDAYDGVVARVADARTCSTLTRCRMPVVDVFSHFEGTGFIRVETDHVKVGRMAAKYFLSKGYSSFAYCGFSGTAYSDVRRDAFAARLAEAEKPCESYDVEEPPDDSVVFNESPERPSDAPRRACCSPPWTTPPRRSGIRPSASRRSNLSSARPLSTIP